MNYLVKALMAGGGEAPATCTITSDESDFTDATPFEIQIVFSKPVTGFVVGDITITKATLSSFAGSGTSYTADVTPDLSGGDIVISVAANVTTEGNSASNTVTVTDAVVLTDQGFDLLLGTPGSHTLVGGDDAHIINETGGVLAASVWHAKSNPHTDTTLRYFECVVGGTAHSTLGNIGYGSDTVSTFVGNGADAAGYLVGVRQVRENGGTLHSGIQGLSPGDVAFAYTRGQKVWFGYYSTTHGHGYIGGGNPYTDTTPTVTVAATGNLRPICTCLYDDSDILINTVGDWINPNVTGSASPWDS